MSHSVKCPVCGREFRNEPMKTWKYGIYTVKRFECAHCKGKFNLYESSKSMFTIPRGKRKSLLITRKSK